MAPSANVPLLFIAILLLVHTSGVKSSKPLTFDLQFSGGVKAGYWYSLDRFPASSIDTAYFTHIFYAFILPQNTTYKLNVTQHDQTTIPEFMSALRAREPPVKTLLSIGGAASVSSVFSSMASNNQTRQTFINSTIEVARTYGFDGVDFDWEYPGDDRDMSNLASLLQEWRKALVIEAQISQKPPLLLTSAVYYASRFDLFGPQRSYPAQEMAQYLDWVSPMCYDYHGSWENFTGPNAALFDLNTNLSTFYGIGSWIEAGVPSEKLVMGLPLYGHTWKLRYPYVNGIGAPAVDVGPGNGFLKYSDVIDLNVKNNATVEFDMYSVSYYSYARDSWIGYDDVRSIRKKVRFSRSSRLLGYFFWAIGQDKDWILSKQASKAWDSDWL